MPRSRALKRGWPLVIGRPPPLPDPGGPVAPPGFVILTRSDGTILTRPDGTILMKVAA